MTVRLLILFSFLVLLLGGCREETSTKARRVITVKASPVYNKLYFSGNLLPDKVFNVTAPTDGAIINQYFSYGQQVKKAQPLFLIKSSEIRKDFEDALASYLKAKEDYNHQSTNFKSEASLYQHQLISRDEYRQAQSSFYLARLALLQAQLALKKATRYIPHAQEIYALSISDIQKITETFSHDESIDDIHINAPAAGTALFPTKTDSTSDDGSGGKIDVGSLVKQGQLLVTIGSSAGLSLSAKASEIEINELKLGMPVDVTSVAFPGKTLTGHVTEIDNQATVDASLPQFNLKILVTEIPPAVKKLIRIGMDAKATITIQGDDAIQVPISAVKQNPQTGQSVVQRVDPTTGTPAEQVVLTGKTQADSVVILEGLKAGDKILD